MNNLWQMVTPVPDYLKPEDILSQGCVQTDESVGQFAQRYILWRAEEYRIEFELHETSITEQDGTRLFGTLSDGTAPHPNEHSVMLEGFCKYDGCTQWWYENEPWHYDEPDGCPDVRNIIKQIRSIAKLNIPHWIDEQP